MATNYLLKFNGGQIEGESKVQGYEDWILLESYNWGATQTGTFSYNQGGGGGKVSMHDFNFRMKTNKASPKLMEACANALHINSVRFVALKPGGPGKLVESTTVTLNNVIVSSYTTGIQTGNDDISSCQIGLNFSMVHFTHTPQTDQGSSGKTVDGTWDLRKQKSGQ